MRHMKKFNENEVNFSGYEPTVVYYGFFNGGDGSVFLRWYLDPDMASDEEESQSEGWGEDCTGSVETFVGSDIHKDAVKNDLKIKNDPSRAIIEEMSNITDVQEIEDWVDKYVESSYDKNKDGVNQIRNKRIESKYNLSRLIDKIKSPSVKGNWRTVIRNTSN